MSIIWDVLQICVEMQLKSVPNLRHCETNTKRRENSLRHRHEMFVMGYDCAADLVCKALRNLQYFKQ